MWFSTTNQVWSDVVKGAISDLPSSLVKFVAQGWYQWPKINEPCVLHSSPNGIERGGPGCKHHGKGLVTYRSRYTECHLLLWLTALLFWTLCSVLVCCD